LNDVVVKYYTVTSLKDTSKEQTTQKAGK